MSGSGKPAARPAFIYRWCRKYGLTEDTAKYLEEHGVNSLNTVLALTGKTIKEYKLEGSQVIQLLTALHQFKNVDIPKISQEISSTPPSNRKGAAEDPKELHARVRKKRPPADGASGTLAERIQNSRRSQSGSAASMGSTSSDNSTNSTEGTKSDAEPEKANEERPKAEKKAAKKAKAKAKPKTDEEKDVAALDAELDNMLDDILSSTGPPRNKDEDPLKKVDDILDSGLFDDEEKKMIEEYNRKKKAGTVDKELDALVKET